jgi:hypothetical protein
LRSARRFSSALAPASIHGHSLVLAKLVRIWIDFARLVVVGASPLALLLGLDSLTLGSSLIVLGLGGTFLGFRLSAPSLGAVALGRGASALGLDGPAARLLAQLAGLAAPRVKPAPSRRRHCQREQSKQNQPTNDDRDHRSGTHISSSIAY